jgi:beta-glucosidase
VDLRAGRPVSVVADSDPVDGLPAGGLQVGLVAPTPPDPLGDAVAAAAGADVAVVVVGGDDQWETEGRDRSSFALPDGQADLVAAICRANPATVVVLNCGSPVDLDGLLDAPAIMVAWYPGQEAGEAITDVLVGDADPGGRLPTTFGRHLHDWASDAHFPGADGVVAYAEGLRVGYRGFDADGIEPVFCFGHGLSTATIEWGEPVLSADEVAAAGLSPTRASTQAAVVSLRLSNTGSRPGTEVVQVYLAPLGGDVAHGPGTAADPSGSRRPPQHLAGFAKVHLGPGESRVVEVPVRTAGLRRWVQGRGWVVPTGDWEVRVSASSRDHRGRLRLRVT